MLRPLLTSLALVALAASCAEPPTDHVSLHADEQVTGTVELFVGADGKHYFRVVTAEGDKLMRSQAYATLEEAEADAAEAKRIGVDAGRYTLLESIHFEHYFVLGTEDGDVLATSNERWASKEEAQKG